MKGMAWESPRGPMSIDRETRDVIQNVYVRRVERVDGQLWNVEFQTVSAVKDPGEAEIGAGTRGRHTTADRTLRADAPSSSTASPTACCCSCSPSGWR